MTTDKGILIRNVYYMLAYAFQVLRQNNYEDISKENFTRIQDLFAEILYRGISSQIKQGLYKEYIVRNESLTRLKGKLDINATIRNRIQHRQEIACEYDDLSVNNIFNQILKTTALILVREKSVEKSRRAALKTLMPFLDGIDTIDPTSIHWGLLHFQRNNRSYQMLMNVCYFVLDGMLLTTESGEYRMATFSDEHLNKLFEHFVLEYYRKEYAGRLTANASVVEWAFDNKDSSKGLLFMPKMQSDIMLKQGDQTLIIDTKYYGKVLQTQYDKTTVHNANLYQIMAYVNNEDKLNTGKVSGMLLYAKTQEEVSPDMDFVIKGNRFMVKTLDLNLEFALIRKQLDGVAESVFPKINVLKVDAGDKQD